MGKKTLKGKIRIGSQKARAELSISMRRTWSRVIAEQYVTVFRLSET